MRRGGAKIGIGFVSLLFAFVLSISVLEIWLRLFGVPPPQTPGFTVTHPRRRYELRSHFRGTTYAAPLHVNSYNLRDFERPIDLSIAATRVLVLGDSMTFGQGVRMEETFPKVLEQHLRAFTRHQVQVFNLGVPSYNTVSEYRYLEDVYEKFKPQLVIVQFTVGNDSELIDFGNIDAFVNESWFLRWTKDLLRHAYSYDWLARRYYLARHTMESLLPRKKEFQQTKTNAYKDNFKGWVECQKAMYDFAKMAAHKGFALIFAIYANNTQLESTYEKDPYYPVVKKVKGALANALIDQVVLMDDAYRSYSGQERLLWVTPEDAHFSSLAHKLVGEHLFHYIVENRILEKAKLPGIVAANPTWIH